jgi:hypothetical protein
LSRVAGRAGSVRVAAKFIATRTPRCAAEVSSLMTKPSTARSSGICRVTNCFIPFVCATISPKPTVAKTVPVKYGRPGQERADGEIEPVAPYPGRPARDDPARLQEGGLGPRPADVQGPRRGGLRPGELQRGEPGVDAARGGGAAHVLTDAPTQCSGRR